MKYTDLDLGKYKTYLLLKEKWENGYCWTIRFLNDFGANIMKNDGSPGHEDDLFSFLPIQFSFDDNWNLHKFEFCSKCMVIGNDEVLALLKEIKKQKKIINYSVVHPILNAIPTDNFRKKKEIMGITGMDERDARDLISKASKDVCIYHSCSNKSGGYRKGKQFEEMSIEEFEKDFNDGQHAINDLQSRMDDYKHRMRPLVARDKAMQKHLAKKGYLVEHTENGVRVVKNE